MKRKIRILLLVLIILFIAAQFVPKFTNDSAKIATNDITRVYLLPDNVQAIFKKSCYDCHSNRTNYPWYSNIQPIRYVLDSHVQQGKADLNFNEFGAYSERKKRSKLRAIGNSLKDETMPISSYLFIHRYAKLTSQDKAIILNWVNKNQ